MACVGPASGEAAAGAGGAQPATPAPGGLVDAWHQMADKAQTNSELSLLEEFLCCMVCFQPFDSPKVLQCQHTFCEGCLHKWYGSGGGSKQGLACPTCRVRTPLPVNATIGALPSDFKVTRLGELLKTVLVHEAMETRSCDICAAGNEKKRATHFCAQCSESMCHGCNKLHGMHALFAGHHVVDLAVESSTGKLFCKQHGSRPIKYICQDCNIFICTVCAINVHNSHNVQDLEIGLQKHMEELKQLHSKILEKLEEVKGQHEQLQEVQVLLKGYHDDTEEKIDGQVQGLVDKVEACRAQLHTQISDITFQQDTADILPSVNTMKEAGSNAVKEQAEKQTVLMKESRTKLIEELKVKYDQIRKEVSDRIENLAFHVGSIESLASYMDNMFATTNALEIITVYDDLTARGKSILDIEVQELAPSSFRVMAYKVVSGENNNLGELIDEETLISDFITKMTAPEESIEEETDDDAEEIANVLAAMDGATEDETTDEIMPIASSSSEALAGAIGGHVIDNADLPPPYSNGIDTSPVSTCSSQTSRTSIQSAPELREKSHNRHDIDPRLKRMSMPVTAPENMFYLEHGRGVADGGVCTPPLPHEPWVKASHVRTMSLDEVALKSKIDLDGGSKDSKHATVQHGPSYLPVPNKFDPTKAKAHLMWEKEGMNRMNSVRRSTAKRNRSGSTNSPTSVTNPDLSNPTDVCFLRNGDVLVADKGEKNLQILTADNVMWSKVKDRKQPLVVSKPVAWSQVEPVCVVTAPPLIGELAHLPATDGDLVVITDSKDKCIKLIDTSNKAGSCVAAWGKSWFMPMFKQPSGLAITQEGKWVVSDIGKHCITVHNPDGRVVHTFGSRGKGAYGFEQPKYVAVDHHERILVSDSGNGGVKVYDINGQFLFKIGSKEQSNLTCPTGVCIDGSGNIYIADRHRHCVHMFNSDGCFIRQVVTQKDNIRCPLGVAISPSGQLAITQMDPPAVKYFELR